MRIRARSVLLVAALLVVLTGCVKVDADLEVGKDETVSGKMLMAVDKDAAQTLGTTPDRVREEIEKSIKKNTPEGVSCKAYDEGNYVGTECTLDNVPFKSMSGSDDDLKFQKDGDKFIVSGGTDTSTSALPNQPNLPKPDVKFKITMPGKILEHDPGASIDGNTATYTDPTKMNNIRLVSDDSGGGGFPLWAVIALAAVALVAVGAVVFLLLRGRKSGGAQQVPGQQYPQPYPGQYPGQQWAGQPQQYPSQQAQGGQPWGQPPQGPPQQWGQPGPQQGQQPPQQWAQPGPQPGYPGQPPQGRPPQGQPPQQGQQWGQPGPQQGQQPPQQWGQPGQQEPDDPDPRQ